MSDVTPTEKKSKGASILIIFLVIGLLSYVGYNHFDSIAKVETAKADSIKSVDAVKAKSDSVRNAFVVDSVQNSNKPVADSTKK